MGIQLDLLFESVCYEGFTVLVDFELSNTHCTLNVGNSERHVHVNFLNVQTLNFDGNY